jgi:restriction system protein
MTGSAAGYATGLALRSPRHAMPIPTFDRMLQPLLALATREDITRRSATMSMADHFALSAEDRSQRIPSGASTVVNNRAGWAMTFLTKARLIEKVAPRTYRATPAGRDFLAQHPNGVTVDDLRAIPGWKAAWHSESDDRSGPTVPAAQGSPTKTPAETIDAAVAEAHDALRVKLLESVLAQSPTFFEQLVLDVLIKMGYGGSRETAAKRLGQSGDEGIDGRIDQDALGLDQILVQAKRYAPDHPIDRKTIQAFIGSLAGQGVSKGIFITTSSFAESAREFVLRGSQTKIVLVDGDDLLDLMLRHHVGVRVERTIEMLALDQNYFEDDDA